MCGRFAIWAEDGVLRPLFEVDETVGEGLQPSWNLRPREFARVVLERNSSRQLRTLKWGFVPSWAKAANRPAINARAETLIHKPYFRLAAARQRCLVPANGYFEWQDLGSNSSKQPWFLSAGPSDSVMAFAGVFDAWLNPELPEDDPDRWLRTFAIVTRPTPDALGQIHDRAPVVVPAGFVDEWLDSKIQEPHRVRDLLREIPDPSLVPRQVGPIRGNGPELIHTPS